MQNLMSLFLSWVTHRAGRWVAPSRVTALWDRPELIPSSTGLSLGILGGCDTHPVQGPPQAPVPLWQAMRGPGWHAQLFSRARRHVAGNLLERTESPRGKAHAIGERPPGNTRRPCRGWEAIAGAEPRAPVSPLLARFTPVSGDSQHGPAPARHTAACHGGRVGPQDGAPRNCEGAPRNCEGGLVWKKGLCRCNSVSDLEMRSPWSGVSPKSWPTSP